MQLRSLQHESDEVVYAAYRAAFADYALAPLPDLASFRAFLRRRGADPARSVGAYAGDTLVGLQLTAVGEYGYEAAPTAYDVLTGVVPEHRGHGLAGAMLAHVLTLLRPGEAEQFLLEVLRSNEAAQRAYAKVGFRRTRGYECLELAVEYVRRDPPAANVALRDVERPDWVRLTDLHSWEPSWQNGIGSMQRAEPPPRVVGAFRDGQLIGYAALFEGTGDLARFAVRPDHHREGVGSALLAACVRRLAEGLELLRIVNVPDDASEDLAFWRRRRAETFAQQDELRRPLELG